MKVAVIGTGYVGLVSGVCFAEIGHEVTCVDIRPDIINMLNEGKSPIYEPGLSDLISRNQKQKRISFATSYDSVKSAKVVFLAVGTPSADSGEANLDYLFQSAEQVAKNMVDETIIVIKSTVPIGTHKKVHELVKKNSNKSFYLVNNPEFLKEGSAIDDFMRPDRVIIGRREEYAEKIMNELYSPLVLQGNPIYMMSNLSAEMTKYASNCMLATKISFINDIAKLCDLTGADINEVRKGMTSDKRIGNHFLYPGPGYGGSCFPKDVKALIHTAQENGLDLKVIKAAEEVNKIQKTYMVDKIIKEFGDNLKDKKFAFWGVSFKPKTDDIRETPALDMAQKLVELGAQVNYFDPEASENFENLMQKKSLDKKIKKVDNKYECLNGCHGLVVVTEWAEFRVPDFNEIKTRLKSPNLFDCRNIYSSASTQEVGLKYFAIGKLV